VSVGFGEIEVQLSLLQNLLDFLSYTESATDRNAGVWKLPDLLHRWWWTLVRMLKEVQALITAIAIAKISTVHPEKGAEAVK